MFLLYTIELVAHYEEYRRTLQHMAIFEDPQ
jgi:hypothetical protein